jgi:hypothetical protein
MGWAAGGVLALQLATGIALAACAGLRAFLPLFALGLAGRLELVPLSEAYAWLASWPALTVFGVAVVVELAADKIPVVDHVLDAVQAFVKPCAGALVSATLVADFGPLGLTVGSMLAGGLTSGVVHLTKAKLRWVSTATTAGTANPLLSIAEDAGALAGTVLSLLAPLLLLLLLGTGLVLAWILWRRRTRAIRLR